MLRMLFQCLVSEQQQQLEDSVSLDQNLLEERERMMRQLEVYIRFQYSNYDMYIFYLVYSRVNSFFSLIF